MKMSLRRGREIVVSGTLEQGEVTSRMHEFLEFARSRGYGDSEIVALIQGTH